MKNDFNYTRDDLVDSHSHSFELAWWAALTIAAIGLTAVIIFAAVGGDTYVPQVPPFSCGK